MSRNTSNRGWRTCWSIVLVGLALALLPGEAFAQVSNDKAAAEALFDQGVDLLKAGKFEKACEKLESSQRIDPGIGTLLYLGDCYERLGRIASAWATFREAASKAEAAGEAERARVGAKRADALEPRLAKVTIEMASENMGIPELTVLESGKPMNRALWGTPVPVDPGQLKVVVEAPGYESFQAMITVREATSDNSLEIPPLVALPEQEDNGTEQDAGPAATPLDRGKTGNGRRTMGFVLGGVGVAGLAAGSVFGVIAMSQNKKATNDCPRGPTLCDGDKRAPELTTAARTNAAVSTTAFIAGGVLLASGVVLILSAPKTKRTARIGLSPTLGGANLTLGGSF